ncbi:uncharacterized protein [Dysidea avara]|uniref:uncharacterized protein isoform X2 n=1 Tax=Dysidea avara TaxID=196820 RepID=UPI003332F6D5
MRLMLVSGALACMLFSWWEDTEDQSLSKLLEIRKWFHENIPDLESAQCNPVSTPPSDRHMTIVTYGRDTPDHHGYAELSSVIARDRSLLKGVDISVGVLQGMIQDKQSAESLHIFKYTEVSVVSLVNTPIKNEDTMGIPSMLNYFKNSLQNLKWVGLSAQSYVICDVNGIKVGFIAVCMPHTDCSHDPTPNKYQSLAPVIYHKESFQSTVKQLHSHGASSVVVLTYWGRQHALIPEDHTLLTAQQMSAAGANLIIGNYPLVMQDHAYIGNNTLVIFSQGSVSVNKNDLCWTEGDPDWYFKEEVRGCRLVHPHLRERLKHDERQMRLYKIMISDNGLVHADYLTIDLVESAWKPSCLKASHSGTKLWTRACSSEDAHCLTCDYY